LRLLKAKVLDDAKLPRSLADRLMGETEEELVEDAKELAKMLVPSNASVGGSSNPGSGQGDEAAKAKALAEERNKGKTADPAGFNPWGK